VRRLKEAERITSEGTDLGRASRRVKPASADPAPTGDKSWMGSLAGK
jgi:hypothetical protein